MGKLNLKPGSKLYDPPSFWDRLHHQPRFRPLYPSEHVVRFLVRYYRPVLERGKSPKILDIGVGGGRHTKLVWELGFDAFGIDISTVGLKYTRSWILNQGGRTELVRASMGALPFKSEEFDAVISFGVFNYGTAKEMCMAIREVHRILRAKGKAFIVLRTTQDYRYGKGDSIEPNTFLLRIQETNEEGTFQHFLPEKAVFDYFSIFSCLEFEKTETTFMNRQRLNSDWLITVGK